MNHTFRSQPPENASFSEVMDAVDENFAAACTLFERSPAMKNLALRDSYVEIMDQAMVGEIPVERAIAMILDLAV
ncbi:MAG: hypothetical protein EOO77_23495 [Oxalobacteraceae bacterium]|nr:MAG: hypothetical protein EOO77_23495 [Oxalobacteraceae bacterium]